MSPLRGSVVWIHTLLQKYHPYGVEEGTIKNRGDSFLKRCIAKRHVEEGTSQKSGILLVLQGNGMP